MVKNHISFLLLFLLLSINSVFAQNTWEKRYYDYENDAPPMYSADTDVKFDSLNSLFVFAGMSHGGLKSVYRLDSLGILFFRSYHTGTGGSLLNSLFSKNGGTIVSNSETIGYAVQTLFKTDTAFTINWKYQYDVPISTSRCGLFETLDNKYLLAGTARYNPYVRPFLIKTDSLGIPLFIKYYKDIFAYSRKIIQTYDGNYLVAANTYLGDGMVLFKTDTSGAVLWAKSYLRPKGFINDMLEKENGNLILVGNTDTTFQTPTSKLFVMEVDSVGNTLWTKTYGDNINRFIFRPVSFAYFRPIKIKQTFDSGYIIVASIMIGNSTHEDLAIVKTDSVGNVQWERRHGIGNQYEVGIQIMQTPDSGYFVAGVFNDDDPWIQNSGYYFLKTDSLGMIGCEDYTDSIAVTNLLPTDSNIIVTDSTLIINIYPAYVHDTSYSPPDTLPVCIPVNIKEFYKNWFAPVVFPNPTAGVVNISIPEGMEGEKNIFVYDLLGKEIYSVQNATERQIDIDLSKNAEGIYLLKVSTAKWSAEVKVVLY